MATKTTYSQKLLDPRWQKKRLEILQRDNWTCQECGDVENTLHVHHKIYESHLQPWDVSNNILITLCASCHKEEHESQSDLEKTLIGDLYKSGFKKHDLLTLAQAFFYLNFHNPEIDKSEFANAILSFLDHEEIPKMIIKDYRNMLKRQAEYRKNNPVPQDDSLPF